MSVKANGDLNWARITGDSSQNEHSKAVLFDEESGSIFVGGRTKGFDIGNPYDILTSKLDSMGNLEWSKLYGGGGFN